MSRILPVTLMDTLRIHRSENLAHLRAGHPERIQFTQERDYPIGRRWLITDILTETPCSLEAVRHLRRLFPEYDPQEWSFLLTDYEILTQDVLEAFLLERMVDLNHNTLLFYALSSAREMRLSEQQEMGETLLEAGVDVNECDGANRTPLLMGYLEEALYEIEASDVEEHTHAILPWLLERGADPLLENRVGMNAIGLVAGFRGVPRRQKDWILTELSRWT